MRWPEMPSLRREKTRKLKYTPTRALTWMIVGG
jgi:hypothetical protein